MTNSQTDNPQQPPVSYSPEQQEEEIDLLELLGVLLENKWLIMLITAVFVFAGVAKALIDQPVYKADALLQIHETSQKLAGFDSLADMMKTELPVMAEIELIKSRMVLGAAINNLQLDIIAQPRYFPLIGEPVARRFQQDDADDAVSNPLFWLSRYAWGGEAIQVDRLDVPTDWEDEALILQAGKQGRYQLINKAEEKVILEGEVGKPASKQLGNNQQSVSIFVSQLKCRPGTQFTVTRRSLNNAIKHLRANLTVAEKGKGTGILELTMESYSPDSAVQILDEIANIYVRQNVEQKSSESQKTLEFLEKQLPALKEQLETAGDALNDYRNSKGSVNLDLEAQNILKEIVEVKTETTKLQQKRDELRQKYTESHPKIIAIDKQIARLEEQMRSNNDVVKGLPETQQVVMGLSEDVQVTSSLYSSLLNNVQTLRVAKAGTVGDVRIIDHALLPDEPIKPQKKLIVAIAFALGLFVGVVAVFVRKLLLRGVEDPDLIEKQLNIPVYATVPHSKVQEGINTKQNKTKISGSLPAILAADKSEDTAVESLRSLRTTMLFAMLEARNNMILITGPSPGVGKTFVSTNLAIVMADAGKKILLIDGDIRRGTIHNMFGVGRENGLSEIILNTVPVQEAIRKIAIGGIDSAASIDFIPTGAIPPNPSELLMHENLGLFLDGIADQYDYVVIDSAPILAVTDPAIIGCLTSAVFMVVKAGMHNTMREIEQSKKRLVQNGVNIKGIIFNDMPRLSSRYGYGGYGKYAYQYSYD